MAEREKEDERKILARVYEFILEAGRNAIESKDTD
jgi:hypothetical protein